MQDNHDFARTAGSLLRRPVRRFAAIAACAIVGLLLVADLSRMPQDQRTTRWAIEVIEVYRKTLSGKPRLIHCRYQETCSRYAQRALREQGFAKGLILSAVRLSHCW